LFGLNPSRPRPRPRPLTSSASPLESSVKI
jgi:hypothetical protein